MQVQLATRGAPLQQLIAHSTGIMHAIDVNKVPYSMSKIC